MKTNTIIIVFLIIAVLGLGWINKIQNEQIQTLADEVNLNRDALNLIGEYLGFEK